MRVLPIKEFLLENYEMDVIKDICNHGCVGGVNGLIYYAETVSFHDRHEAEIWDMLEEHREENGDDSIMEMIGNFSPKSLRSIGSMTQFKNFLCWWSVEVRANEIVNELEGNDL